jgi:hypothetical protein
MKLVGLLALMFAGLGTSIAFAEKAPISIRGEVTKLNDGRMLVEGKKEKDTDYDKASVTITKDTMILRAEGELLKPAKLEDIKVGMILEITFKGPVAESYPVQAKAGKVVILPKEEKKK